MKVGDLVRHKKTRKAYLIVGDSMARRAGYVRGLVGIIRDDGTLGFMARSWLEVIDEVSD